MANDEIAVKNPLVLAFVGDACWTLHVRESLGRDSFDKVGKLHLSANKYVCAGGQAVMFEKIAPFLSEVETAIAGRARNANSHAAPKSCKLSEYKMATAFEAVIGYNYLTGNKKRLENLFNLLGDIK